MRKHKIRVGITMGDPSGIGPVVIAKALRKIGGAADFTVIGDKWVFSKNQNCSFIDLKNVSRKNFAAGKIKADYGRASIEYLDKALELIRGKEIDCLVTCPISKEAINKAGYAYTGHTEYFSERTHAKDTVMMLLNKELKFSLVTRHIPLKKVPLILNENILTKAILITCHSLKKLFQIKEPRIVVCGLNPHASDNGVIGNEENKIIRPAIKKIKDKYNIYIDGPYSADAAIYRARLKDYDCVIAMYHDQALIPLKSGANSSGVNLTLGLAFVRTSPLHGTAFDIAANPALANPDSLIAAIMLAIKCTLNQKKD